MAVMIFKIYILIFMLSFCLLCGLSIGDYFAIDRIIKTAGSCIIEEYTNRNCYERNANLILEQYVKIDKNRTGFILCGPVLNCLTSPCNGAPKIGSSNKCMLYKKDLYWIDEYPTGLVFGAIVIFICIVVIFGLLIILLIFLVIDSYIYKYQFYDKIDSDDNVNMEDSNISNKI